MQTEKAGHFRLREHGYRVSGGNMHVRLKYSNGKES